MRENKSVTREARETDGLSEKNCVSLRKRMVMTLLYKHKDTHTHTYTSHILTSLHPYILVCKCVRFYYSCTICPANGKPVHRVIHSTDRGHTVTNPCGYTTSQADLLQDQCGQRSFCFFCNQSYTWFHFFSQR